MLQYLFLNIKNLLVLNRFLNLQLLKLLFYFEIVFLQHQLTELIVVDVALNSLGGFPNNTANLPVPNNSINLLSSPCQRIAKDREQARTTASINFEVKEDMHIFE